MSVDVDGDEPGDATTRREGGRAAALAKHEERQQQWEDAKYRGRKLRHKYRIARRKYGAKYDDYFEEVNNFFFPVEVGTLKEHYEIDLLYCESVFLRDPFGRRALRVVDKKQVRPYHSPHVFSACVGSPFVACIPLFFLNAVADF